MVRGRVVKLMYLDMFLLVNLGMNCCILKTTSIMTGCETSWKKIMCGAAVGSILAGVSYTWMLEAYWWWLFTISSPFLMVLITFGRVKVREAFSLIVTVFLTAFLLGGALEAILNTGAGMESGAEVSVWWLAFAVVLVSILLYLVRPYLEDKNWQKELKARLVIKMGEVRKTVPALLDTGNRLKEPFGQKPVILLDYRELKSLIPQEAGFILEDNSFDPVEIMENIEGHPESGRFFLIPFSGVKGGRGMLLGFRPDEITVIKGEESREISSRVALGLSPKAFGSADEIKALMPPDILRMVV